MIDTCVAFLGISSDAQWTPETVMKMAFWLLFFAGLFESFNRSRK